MENTQKSVMLLRPDAHVMGRWEGGATLKIHPAAGGVSLSLKMDARSGQGGTLMLLMRDGTLRPAGELSGDAVSITLHGIQPADIAAAALVRENSFVLKSSWANWPSVVAQYRFARAQAAPGGSAAGAVPLETAAEAIPAFAPVGEPLPTENEKDASAPSQEPETTDGGTVQERPFDPEPQSDMPNPREETGRPATHLSDAECSAGIRQNNIDPFPGMYPGSEWVKISYPGPMGWWHYIFGRVQLNGREADAIGVPGEYSMTPPAWLDGFSTWTRCTSGDARGYWLMFQDAQTGQYLDTGRSRRGV